MLISFLFSDRFRLTVLTVVRLSSLWKCVALAVGFFFVLASSIYVPSIFVNRVGIVKSLSNAKQIGLACKQYAIDNDGHFPPSLNALFPTYLSTRSVLVSPLAPGEPIGYIYTVGLTDTSATDSVLIEDKFAPKAKHKRIVVYADDSARVLNNDDDR